MSWLYRQKGSANWWVGYRVGGKQVLRSTGTADRALAEREMTRLNTLFQHNVTGTLTEELYAALTGRAVSAIPLKRGLDEWIAECRASTSPGTVERYELVAREFAAHVNASEAGPSLTAITSEHVRSYLTKKRISTSASNANLGRKVLSIFFHRAIANEQIKTNPILAVKRFKSGQDEQAKRRAYTLAELELLFRKAPDNFWRYMILGEFYTGIRMGDLICLRWTAVDFQNKLIRLTPNKTGGKTLTIPLYPSFRDLLTRLDTGSNHGAADYIWPEQAARYEKSGSNSFSNEFYDTVLTPCGLVPPRKSKSASKSGRSARRQLNQISFHSIRHSFVSALRISGSNQAIAKELAGHSSDQVNDLYTHLPVEVLAGAIGQLPEIAK